MTCSLSVVVHAELHLVFPHHDSYVLDSSNFASELWVYCPGSLGLWSAYTIDFVHSHHAADPPSLSTDSF